MKAYNFRTFVEIDENHENEKIGRREALEIRLILKHEPRSWTMNVKKWEIYVQLKLLQSLMQ